MTKPSTNPEPYKGKGIFDPFVIPQLSQTSKVWLWATGLQMIFTAGLLALSWWAEGHSWAAHVRAILILGIVGTWGLALRTIRERIFELMRIWHKTSTGLLKKASDSGKHLIEHPLSPTQEKYIRSAIWRLRIIAAGITLPFFVMPLLWCMIGVVFSWQMASVPMRDYWAAVAVFMLLTSMLVMGYFHWVVLPIPVKVVAQNRSRYPVNTRSAHTRSRH